MFIIGAGASANCVFSKDKKKFEKDKFRPPLGNELFSDRFQEIYKNYPGVRESLYYLQDNADIETMLENDWEDIYETGNVSVMKRHINIQYYLQHLLASVSRNIEYNYDSFNLFAKLADTLKRIHAYSPANKKQTFAFVSFNQDTILETFLSKYLLRHLDSLQDYIGINENPFCLFKPHGSWNWGWKFPVQSVNLSMGTISKWLHENNKGFYNLYFELLGNHIDMVDWGGWGMEGATHRDSLCKYTIDKNKITFLDENNFDHFYPAMLLPYRDKDEFTMPPAHFDTLNAYLNNIETMVIIGWKGNEAAFLKLLSQQGHNIKKVVIVDPNPKVLEENLKFILTKPEVEKKYYSDFENFVMTGMEKEINENKIIA